MLQLNGLRYENEGRRIVYDYSYHDSLSKYFNKKESFFVEYGCDVSQVPQSLAVVPFLANFAPIAWFVGFDVSLAVADATFLNSLEALKKEFAVHFPQMKPGSKVICDSSETNVIDGNETALLFSGGLDAFEALTRNIALNPYLVSVWGADIELSDNKRWDEFRHFNSEESIISDDRVRYVKSNLRTFYTHHVDLLVDISWWGKVQHGMALISLIAPLSYLNNINSVLIASSNTGEVSFGWGSTSETDEKVKWATMHVVHDGFHLRRTEKVENIVSFAKATQHKTQLRVCYSELRVGKNCSKCAKCQRTMLAFLLCGANPDEYGFTIPSNFYELLFKNFGPNVVMTAGIAYEWRCLQEKAAQGTLYVISDEENERNIIATFAALPLDEIANRDADGQLRKKRLKFTIISKFPKLFQLYLKLRRATK